MRSTPPKSESAAKAPAAHSIPPIAHLPTLLRRLRVASCTVRRHFNKRRRRGYDVRDALAAVVAAALSAVEVTLRRDGPEAALAVLRDLDGLADASAEAVTRCRGPRPLTAGEVFERLAAAGVDVTRYLCGKVLRGALDRRGCRPFLAFVTRDGNWHVEAADADLDGDLRAALAAHPEAWAVVSFFSGRFHAATRGPHEVSEKL